MLMFNQPTYADWNFPLCLNSKIDGLPGASVVELLVTEPVHEISSNVVCATSKASDQPAHMRSLIRAFARRLNIL